MHLFEKEGFFRGGVYQASSGQARLKLKLGLKRNTKFGFNTTHHHKLLGQFQGT
jgi:hypothetical protein